MKLKIIIIFLFISCCTNMVNSVDDRIWYSYQFGSGFGNREELVISKVESVNFKPKEHVIKWKSLSLRHISYAVGLTENGITSMQAVIDPSKNGSFNINSIYLSMDGTVKDAVLLEYKRNYVISIIAYNNSRGLFDIHWYKITNNNELIILWKVENYKKNISQLNTFKIDKRNFVLIFNEYKENYTIADLYEFNLENKSKFWYVQSFELETPTSCSTINTFGSDTYLSIPVESKVIIFKYKNNMFVHFKDLVARHVRYVSSFKIGFQSFLAIDGYDAGIYKFNKNNLFKEEIQENVINGIDYWISTPVKTYRDEEIIIGERPLNHSTHKSYDIIVMLYNGEKFVIHEEMLCDYHGTEVHGMHCLFEESNGHGIKGSAFLALKGTVGIIVPTQNASSALFIIHTNLKNLDSPIEKQVKALNGLKEKLEKRIKFHKFNLIKEDDELIKSGDSDVEIVGAARLDIPKAEAAKSQQDSTIIRTFNNLANKVNKIQNDILTIQSNFNNSFLSTGSFNNLIINGLVKVKDNSEITTVESEQFNNEHIEKIFLDFVRMDNMSFIQSQKTFNKLNVRSLAFESVNSIPSLIIARQNSTVTIKGNIIFTENVTIAGPIKVGHFNNLNLEEEVIQVNNNYSDALQIERLNIKELLETRNINKFAIHNKYLQTSQNEENPTNLEAEKFDQLFIAGNITVEKVNGENFNNFISSLCLKNLKTYIPHETNVIGSISVSNTTFANKLNSIKYPEEYIFSNIKTDNFLKINGAKMFNKLMHIEELTTSTINNIIPNNVITLSGIQEVENKFTFKNLIITESLKVENLTGTVINQFQPKPTLRDAKTINSSISFKSLEVDGTITIDKSFNDLPFYGILDDVIYKDMESVEITSIKNFANSITVQDNLLLASNKINKIPMDTLINQESSQVITTKTLNGAVTFENLLLLGTYGNINISKLDQESVKLTGEQFIESKLVFDEKLVVEDLEITKIFNDIHYSEYLYTDDNVDLNDIRFEKLKVNNLIVNGKLITNNSNFNLSNFDKRRLSYAKNQGISGSVYINQSRISHLKPTFINNYKFDDLFNLNKYSEKISSMIQDGSIAIKELYVESTNVTSVDNVSMADIMRNCIFTNEREQTKHLILQDNVYFQNIQIENFNKILFSKFANNVIYKDEKNVSISGIKVYQNGLVVNNYINSPMLNNIKIENILRKGGNQSIKSNVTIIGNVLLHDKIEVEEAINSVPMEHILTSFEEDFNHIKIARDVIFAKLVFIDDLIIKERLNNINITEFMRNIINTTEDAIIFEKINFQHPVDIKGNIAVNNKVNNIDFAKLKEEIVLITEDAIIESLVKFENPVIVNEEVLVETDLIGQLVMEINLELWKPNAVFINDGLISGIIKFERATVYANINAEYFNRIRLTSLISLRTQESIIGKLEFIELLSFNNIDVDNFVNGYKLEPEFLNTILADRPQKIKSKVIFENNILVNKMLTIPGYVNNVDINTLVYLNVPQNLTTPYQFLNKITITNNIDVHGLISGINIKNWVVDGVKKYSPEPQVINSRWNLHKHLTFANNTIGNGIISNLDVRKVANNAEGMRQFKSLVETDLLYRFKNVCIDINDLIGVAAKRQVYLFKYLDDYQTIDIPYIKHVHQFENKEDTYLLISQENNCISSLYIWFNSDFIEVQKIKTGIISQMITVPDGDSIYFVSRDDNLGQCDIEGTNIWKFDIDNIIPLYNIDNQLLLMDSLIPGIFYGMSQSLVMEFKLSSQLIKPIRKWHLNTENAAFVPHGLDSGLATRNGHYMFKLNRNEVILDNNFGENYNSLIIGNISIHNNTFMPGRDSGDLLVMKVGYPRRKTLVAIPSHEETSVKEKLDFITIYENVMDGSIYHKIPTYKPSSITSMQFEQNGETILIFLEDKTLLQIFEYRGIEGFKHRTTASVEGKELISLKLQYNNKVNNFIGVINDDYLKIMIAVMDGDQIHESKLKCNL